MRLDFKNVKTKTSSWLRDTMNLLPRDSHPNGMTAATFKNRREITRDMMAERLVAVFQTNNTQAEMITHLRSETLKFKTDMITKQDHVIVLQEGLIAAKDDQLNDLKETFVCSVGDTLQTQLKSYSEAVHGSRNGCSLSGSGNLLDQNVLKSVVKDVVAEEDRSRNLLIFGLWRSWEKNRS